MVDATVSDCGACALAPRPGARRGANGPAVAASVVLHVALLALCTWTVVAPTPEPPPIRVTLLGTRDAGGSRAVGAIAAPPLADHPPAPPPAAVVAPPKPIDAPAPLRRAAPVRKPAARVAPAPAHGARAAPAAAPAPAASSQAATAGTAAGSGGGSGGGHGAGAQPGTAGDPNGSAIAGYLGRLRGRLEAVKRYPALARRRGSTGTAMLSIVIARDGRPAAIRIQRSSGSDLLDEEATAMVGRAAPFDPLPAELAGDTLRITVPVRFDVSG